MKAREGRSINPPDAPRTSDRNSQAVEVTGATRTIYASGQIPLDAPGRAPEDFAEQARLTGTNIEAQLRAADMSLSDIVKVTTYLSNGVHAQANGCVRREALGDLAPALTVIICRNCDRALLLGIECVVAA